LKIESGDNISPAIPTSVDIIGVLVRFWFALVFEKNN